MSQFVQSLRCHGQVAVGRAVGVPGGCRIAERGQVGGWRGIASVQDGQAERAPVARPTDVGLGPVRGFRVEVVDRRRQPALGGQCAQQVLPVAAAAEQHFGGVRGERAEAAAGVLGQGEVDAVRAGGAVAAALE
ncbi:MAG: hypothetical protein HOV87_01220 [Catenulispora sp.]|nr:hypothetical protein [Catenulispora sp.]